MRYAIAMFQDGEMVPALYCKACALRYGPLESQARRWETVLLSEDDDFCCDECFTTEAPSTAMNGSAWLQDELEPALNCWHARERYLGNRARQGMRAWDQAGREYHSAI